MAEFRYTRPTELAERGAPHVHQIRKQFAPLYPLRKLSLDSNVKSHDQ